MAAVDLTHFAASSAARLVKARAVADSLRHDDQLHRLAMHAVFVLEDCHEALVSRCRGHEDPSREERADWQTKISAVPLSKVTIVRSTLKLSIWALGICFALCAAALCIEGIDPAPAVVNAAPSISP